ncbi:hypothetical protein ACU4HD_25420 [Cupriavidus basilensis]
MTKADPYTDGARKAERLHRRRRAQGRPVHRGGALRKADPYTDGALVGKADPFSDGQ